MSPIFFLIKAMGDSDDRPTCAVILDAGNHAWRFGVLDEDFDEKAMLAGVLEVMGTHDERLAKLTEYVRGQEGKSGEKLLHLVVCMRGCLAKGHDLHRCFGVQPSVHAASHATYMQRTLHAACTRHVRCMHAACMQASQRPSLCTLAAANSPSKTRPLQVLLGLVRTCSDLSQATVLDESRARTEQGGNALAVRDSHWDLLGPQSFRPVRTC